MIQIQEQRRSVLEAEIRFQLEQLSVRNAHHDFETICRRHARERICDRVIPATGPVADGGDQGRDFETFKSYRMPKGTSVFAGSDLAWTKDLVFACTVQKRRIGEKIKSDVATILSEGEKPDRVYFYSVQDIPVAHRHRLQKWVRETYGIGLDIFDGHAISEELATPRLFWIAVEHLNISAEKAPPPEKPVEQWYRDSLIRWRDHSAEVPRTTAEYLAMRESARHFLDDPTVKGDLMVWLDALALFANSEFNWLACEAQYERLVLSIRGRGTLEGREDEIGHYINMVVEHGRIQDLKNASIVLTYTNAARSRGAVAATEAQLLSWRKSVRLRVDNELKSATSSLDRAHLLDAHANLDLILLNNEESDQAFHNALSRWQEVLTIAKRESLFPIQSIAKCITILTPLLVRVQGFQALADECDSIITKRVGNAGAAAAARDRGMALFQAGMFIEAIEHIHKAKSLWFGKETLRGTLLSMSMLALCYSKINCFLASKYYAMTVVLLATNDEKLEHTDLAARGLAMAALDDFNEGAWLSHLALVQLFTPVQQQFDADPGNINKHEHLQWLCMSVGTIISWARINEPRLEHQVKDLLVGHPLLEIAEELAAEAGPTPNLTAPIADAGPIRNWQWKALGVTWGISWRNDHATTSIAEAFGAILQILCVDISNEELEMLATNIEVEVKVDSGAHEGIEAVSEVGRDWILCTKPAESYTSQELSQLLGVSAIRVLGGVSLTPGFMNALERRFDAGLVEKTLTVRSYSRLYNSLVGPDAFANTVLALRDPTHAGVITAEEPVPQLQWRTGLSPRYRMLNVPEMLANRYDAATKSTSRTLPRLAKDPVFRALVQKLRSQGWLGWQICTAISIMTVSYILERKYGQHWALDSRATADMRRAICDSEESDPGLPIEYYDEKSLVNQMQANLLSTLRQLGLVFREPRIGDIEAVKEYLATRFRFFSDDVPELDPLRNFDL